MFKKERNKNSYDLRKGDIVTRKSYGHDILFCVKIWEIYSYRYIMNVKYFNKKIAIELL